MVQDLGVLSGVEHHNQPVSVSFVRLEITAYVTLTGKEAHQSSKLRCTKT